jgi:hypothetical protein
MLPTKIKPSSTRCIMTQFPDGFLQRCQKVDALLSLTEYAKQQAASRGLVIPDSALLELALYIKQDEGFGVSLVGFDQDDDGDGGVSIDG